MPRSITFWRILLPSSLLVLASAMLISLVNWESKAQAEQQHHSHSGELVLGRSGDLPYRVAQNTGGLTLKTLIDAKRNRDYVKADSDFPSMVYAAIATVDVIKIRPASRRVLDAWKGNASIDFTFIDDESQFAPVFLFAEIRNDGLRAAQVIGAYLAVNESAIDFQPFLTLSGVNSAGCSNRGL